METCLAGTKDRVAHEFNDSTSMDSAIFSSYQQHLRFTEHLQASSAWQLARPGYCSSPKAPSSAMGNCSSAPAVVEPFEAVKNPRSNKPASFKRQQSAAPKPAEPLAETCLEEPAPSPASKDAELLDSLAGQLEGNLNRLQSAANACQDMLRRGSCSGSAQENLPASTPQVPAGPALAEILRQQPELAAELKGIFLVFANFGSRQLIEEMDSSKFFKLCKDTQLVGRALSPSDVDLIFSKVKARGQRRITFEEFVAALDMVAGHKGRPAVAMVKQILAAGGPVLNSSVQAGFVRWHDDKSTYTGVYSHGGPVTDDKKDLSDMVRRPSPHLGLRTPPPGTHKQHPAGPSTDDSKSSTPAASTTGVHTPEMPSTPRGSTCSSSTPPLTPAPLRQLQRNSCPQEVCAGEVSTEVLREVFTCFASFGQGTACAPATATPEMDSARFAKLCRESGLVGGRLTPTAVDLVFTKVKAKGERRIIFKQFLVALDLLAHEKGVTVGRVKATLAACQGPKLNGVTQAESVRFHYQRAQA